MATLVLVTSARHLAHQRFPKSDLEALTFSDDFHPVSINWFGNHTLVNLQFVVISFDIGSTEVWSLM